MTGVQTCALPISRELKTWYDIMTYKEFAKKIRKFLREEDLEEYMSNKVFYVDEAHNVPTLKDHRRRQHPLTIAESRNESYYQTVFRAFHKGKRNKIVLATATPMINSPADIVTLINLILPLDLIMPNWTEDQFEIITFEQIEPYFRGRISYIRALDTGARPKSMGVIPEGRHTKIFPCDMSAFQYAAYLRSDARDQATLYNEQRYASNFVFPNGTYGIGGFDNYIELVGGRYQFRHDANGQQLQQLLRSDEGLATLSGKYSNIIELCRSSYPDAEIVLDDNKGIIFVYFADYVHGSGAIMLGMGLREQGYEEFQESRDIFISAQGSKRTFGPCTTEVETDIERPGRIPKRPRYALLTGDPHKSRIHTILNTLNSYENRYGHYIQVLIGSKAAREGININNAVKMIMASGSWNASSNVQAKDRVFRSTSHITRIAEKRIRVLEEGGDPDIITMDVETYNMASKIGRAHV